LAIFGPPGTGKTTTLIKRLGLKLDPEYLSEEEREQVRATVAGSARHAQSWIMFTPTDLLRQYVKEAFARENVPASDSHIYTWADYRRELARHKFGILRTTAGTGSFVLKDDLPSLQATTLERQRQWFGDFDGWQAEGFWSDLQSHAKNLASNVDSAIAKIGARLDGIIGGGALDANASAFISISENVDELRALISRLKSDTDAKIRAAIARELGRDRTLLDQLSRFVATLGDAADDADDQDSDEEEEGNQTRIGREAAFEAYARAIRARARAAASGRNMNRQSRAEESLIGSAIDVYPHQNCVLSVALFRYKARYKGLRIRFDVISRACLCAIADFAVTGRPKVGGTARMDLVRLILIRSKLT